MTDLGREVTLGHPSALDIAWLCGAMRADEIQQWLALTGRTEYDADLAARGLLALAGPSFCLVDRSGIPFCAGGFEEVRPKVWQTWMVGTEDGWARYWRAITKYSVTLADNLLADGSAHRIQTYALASRERAHEWYERGLKMQFEATHRRFFADGQDAVCFARVQEDADGRE
jgi:hypothetical protein